MRLFQRWRRPEPKRPVSSRIPLLDELSVLDLRVAAERVRIWVKEAFGAELAEPQAADERALRLLEEALEFAQASGVTRPFALALVERTFGRPPGEPRQEAAQIFLTLLAFAGACGIDLATALNAEWERIDRLGPTHFGRRMAAKRAAGLAMEPPRRSTGGGA